MMIITEPATVKELPSWDNGTFYVVETASGEIYYLNRRDVEEGCQVGDEGFFEMTNKRRYFFKDEPVLGK